MKLKICQLQDIMKMSAKQIEKCMKVNDCLNYEDCPLEPHFKKKFLKEKTCGKDSDS